ncbi:Duplicated homeodomain-like superfamily protein [Rhynchospora pubera]|uniref:Transcription factor MYBS1 n=1 Tax=Rhynchospora pubera TaxID=906938 RepID=A0AAV8HAZ8_9POAL|nr:Duplicated homeodomain-like superfamily protein [Rhynchospora pubera]KAJ4813864.1 Duplicated homeodomain-like superfamily protein [Rhynchospora pubera]
MTRDAWMQVLPPTDHCFNPRRLPLPAPVPTTPPGLGNWTREENKLFEKALACFEEDGPERWQRVAEAIPGKTAREVMAHYRDLVADVTQIEAGLVPLPFPGNFAFSAFTLDWGFSLHNQNHSHQPHYFSTGKRLPGGPAAKHASADQERKKGVPWTQDEHRLFLLGLNKYGKGDWRNISRNFVLTRTPTQVASHAQKYFIRLNSGNKDKRRPSIHDITTTNLPDAIARTSSQSSIFAPPDPIDSKPHIY